MRSLALLAMCACACTGTTGTIDLELVTTPGGNLDAVQRVRLTLTEPRRVVEAERTGSGFDLAIDVEASMRVGSLIVEGFDAAGALVACGQSPRFAVAAINARIVVFMAPPRSVEVAPVALTTPLAEVAGAALSFGAVIAGGRDAQGAPSAALAVYNAYDHSLADGLALPAPRAGVAIAASGAGDVYLFGGTGTDGDPTGTLWRFDSTVAPRGAYLPIADQAGFARTGQLVVPIGSGRYLITGTPALTFDSFTGALTARTDVAGLPATGAAGATDGEARLAVFSGSELVRYRSTGFDTLGAGRNDATATTLPDGRIVVIGGSDPASARDALVVDGATGAVTTIPGAIATPRSRPLLAATSRHLVVAGGTDMAGAPIATAEVLDAKTLAPLATVPILARSGGFAVALPSDQVLLGGGTPASSQLELFTPEPPAP
jgi:hypothetical protein